MILANIRKLERYIGINKNLDTAIRFIAGNDLNQLPLGKTVIDECVFVNVFEYYADNKVGDFFEGHREYLDMHIVIKGKEKMAGLEIENGVLRDTFNIEGDIGIYDGKPEYDVVLENGMCLITFPEDLHEPKVYVDEQQVKKVVFKVKL